MSNAATFANFLNALNRSLSSMVRFSCARRLIFSEGLLTISLTSSLSTSSSCTIRSTPPVIACEMFSKDWSLILKCRLVRSEYDMCPVLSLMKLITFSTRPSSDRSKYFLLLKKPSCSTSFSFEISEFARNPRSLSRNFCELFLMSTHRVSSISLCRSRRVLVKLEYFFSTSPFSLALSPSK